MTVKDVGDACDRGWVTADEARVLVRKAFGFEEPKQPEPEVVETPADTQPVAPEPEVAPEQPVQ